MTDWNAVSDEAFRKSARFFDANYQGAALSARRFALDRVKPWT